MSKLFSVSDLYRRYIDLFTAYSSKKVVEDEESNEVSKAVYDCLNRWDRYDRFFHNIENHLLPMLEVIDTWKTDDKDIYIFAALYHDAVFPESAAAEYFVTTAKKLGFNKEVTKNVEKIILETATRKSTPFNMLDWSIFSVPWDTLVEYEHQIFLEYQKYDYKFYVEKRVEFLEGALKAPCLPKDSMGGPKPNIRALIEYVKSRQPRIGLYCGSFDPFHVGHLDILMKAEKMFDKVIVAVGINAEKGGVSGVASTRRKYLENHLGYRQVDCFFTLASKYIADKGYPLTLIRGIRNGSDLEYELNYLRTLEDLMPCGVPCVYIPCDRQYSHISSSMVRSLKQFDEHKYNSYII